MMEYRMLGSTGLRVSRLGFGAMRLPMNEDGKTVNRELAIPMVHRAIEGGITYFDTAVFYCQGDSQRALGEALEGHRDKVVLATKNHYYDDDEAAWWQNLEDSLERLRTDHIDLYHTHGINWQRYCNDVEPRVGKWLAKAKEQGMIRHIATSFHDAPENLPEIVETGLYESILVQYNIFDRKLEPGMARAHEQGLGVVVMGPVAGGRLGEPSDVLGNLVPGIERVPELALRFVLSNPHVTVALSGMSTMQQVEENIATCSRPIDLSKADVEAINTQMVRLKEMSDLYCTGCKYCLPCPREIDIPGIFNAYNLARVYGVWGRSKESYQQLGNKGAFADACVDFGECEETCPQEIPIRAQLADAHAALST